MLEGQRQVFFSKSVLPVLAVSNAGSPSPVGRRDREKDQSFAKLPGFTTAGAGGVQGWLESVPVAPVGATQCWLLWSESKLQQACCAQEPSLRKKLHSHIVPDIFELDLSPDP